MPVLLSWFSYEQAPDMRCFVICSKTFGCHHIVTSRFQNAIITNFDLESGMTKTDYTKQPLTSKLNSAEPCGRSGEYYACTPESTEKIQHRSSSDKQYEPSDCSLTITADKCGEGDFFRCCAGHACCIQEGQVDTYSNKCSIGGYL